MGLRDRDYMRRSEDEDARVESYEEESRANEYGDLLIQRRRSRQKIGVLLVVVFVLAVVLAAVVSLGK